MLCKKLMVSLISMTAVCGMGIAAPSVRATTSPNTVDTAARAGTLRVPTTKSSTVSSDTTSVRNNDAADVNSRMAYVSGSVGGKLSTKLQQPAPASASALSELERRVRELTDTNAEEINTLRSELGGKLDAEDFAEHFDTRATEKELVDSSTVSSVYATKAELSSVPTSLAFSELTGRVDDAAADIQTLNTELNRKLDKDTADGSYATIAALQGVKNTADSAVTPAMLSTELTSYAKVEDLENIPSSEAFTSLTGRVGTAEGKITTLQSDLAGKANAGDSYTKSESDAQLAAAKQYADTKFDNIEIPDTDLSDYYKKAEVNSAIATAKAGATADAKTYADDTFALKSAVEGKANASDVNSLTGRVGAAEQIITALQTGKANVGDVYTKSEVDDAIDNAVIDGRVDLSGYYKKTETYSKEESNALLADKASASDLTTLSNKVNDTETGLDTKLSAATAAENYVLKSALSDYDTSAQTTAKIQAATNGLASETFASQQAAGALSSAQAYTNEKISNLDLTPDLSNYYTKDETYNQTQIDSAIATAKTNAMDYADDTFALKSTVDSKADASDVNALTGRVGTAEDNIATLQTSLASKANASDVYNKTQVDDKILAASTGLDEEQVSQMINAAVGNNYYDKETADSTFAAKSDLNGLATEGYVTQQINSIDIPDVTDLTSRVGTAEGNITALQTTTSGHTTAISDINTALATKAAASDVNALTTKVNDATTGLDTKLSAAAAAETYALKSALNDKANASDLNTLTGRVDTAEGNITALQTTTSGHTTAISDINTALASKANASDVYNKTQVDDKILAASTGLDEEQVSQMINAAVGNNYYDKETADSTFAAKSDLDGLATEGYVTQQINSIDIPDVTDLTSRVGTAEGNITALQTTTSGHTTALSDINTALAGKLGVDDAAETYATKSSLNGLATEEYVTQEIGKIDIPETDLSDYYNQSEVNTLLATKAAASDVNSLTGRVGTAEGNITTLQSALDSKASASALTTLSNKVNNATTGLDSKASASALTTLSNKVNDATTGLDTKASAGSVYTKTEVDNTLSTYATKSYVDSQAPNVELDYDSDENALVYRNSPIDQWRYIPIAGLQGAPGVTPLLEANDARQAIRVSYDNGQTYTTLVPYETIKGPKGDKGDPGCDDFEVQTEETEGGSRISVICVKND